MPPTLHKFLKAPVSDFIKNNFWHIPMVISVKFPSIVSAINRIQIPLYSKEDFMVWNGSNLGVMSFKGAFLYLNPPKNAIPWCRIIWSSSIPPTKSFIVWRLVHNRLPTDENLKKKGCSNASICNLCNCSEEASSHLFLTCQFAKDIWSWFGSVIYKHIDLSSVNSVLSICEQHN